MISKKNEKDKRAEQNKKNFGHWLLWQLREPVFDTIVLTIIYYQYEYFDFYCWSLYKSYESIFLFSGEVGPDNVGFRLRDCQNFLQLLTIKEKKPDQCR